jgi:exodeoxyribonuclease V alpha subunit
MEHITGTVERITFYNDENHYGVIRIKAEEKFPTIEGPDGTITVVGVLPGITVGETVRFSGAWVTDPRYGKQFKAETLTPVTPSTEIGIVNYLASGIVKGIGAKTARRIVDHFGTETLNVLDREPLRLHEVPGLKRELARDLALAWQENQAIRQTMIFLQGYGVTSKMAARIFKFYGAAAIATVKENPYALADEVNGIGFIRADEIAQNMGLPADAHYRIRAGLVYALNQMTKEGHVYMPRLELVNKAMEMLKIDNVGRVQASLSQETLAGNLIIDANIGDGALGMEAVYLPLFYHAERKVVRLLREQVSEESDIRRHVKGLKWAKFLKDLAEFNEVDLTEQQQSAVRAALEHKVTVLTGGPGTGKTTTLRMVIHALDSLKHKFALASPTGRAAKRLAEATGYPAKTIHRLLGWTPGEGFVYDEDQPLEIDMLIVDEASMIDLLLFNDLLKALPPNAHLMLVGDVDQLPSVGAGNVLRDVIDSGVGYVTRLNAIFRQSNTSHIIVNAHRINQGEAPLTDNNSADFFYFGEDDPARAAELVVDIVKNRLPTKFGVDPINDVQVIAPMYRGVIGVNALNEALQRTLNGDKRMAEKVLGGRAFRVGDKVMQTRNNYEKDVFNGDIGRLVEIDFEEQAFGIDIDGSFVMYDWTEADQLIHAYAISTHRSQGSEYPVVVMPIMTQHYMMLQRNLLYTAVTRAKKLVVLVGSRRAVQMAVENNKVAERYSGLLQLLRG